MNTSRVMQLEKALDGALSDQGLHPGFRSWVRRLVFDEKSDWRVCCGNYCEPCVQPIAQAVDQVRSSIRWRPGELEPARVQAKKQVDAAS